MTRPGNKVRNKVGTMRGIERNAGRRIWVGVKVRSKRNKWRNFGDALRVAQNP